MVVESVPAMVGCYLGEFAVGNGWVPVDVVTVRPERGGGGTPGLVRVGLVAKLQHQSQFHRSTPRVGVVVAASSQRACGGGDGS